MTRRYVRDKRGRFASKGGGASAGKMGKSEKNEKARSKYKEASSKARSAAKIAETFKSAKGSKVSKRETAYWNRQAGGAKSGLTRVTKSLHGGTAKNLGQSKKDKVRQGREALAGMAKTARTRKASTNKATKGRAAKKQTAYKRGEGSTVGQPVGSSGNTRAMGTKPSPRSKADKARAEKAAAIRQIKKERAPKVKQADARAKDLNREADRLEKAFVKQSKVTEKDPSAANKQRLKTIQREARMADRAAKRADKEANKLANQMERELSKVDGKKRSRWTS